MALSAYAELLKLSGQAAGFSWLLQHDERQHGLTRDGNTSVGIPILMTAVMVLFTLVVIPVEVISMSVISSSRSSIIIMITVALATSPFSSSW